MNETILKYAWKFRCFNKAQLFTTDGQEVLVLKPGTENADAGPDFFMAELRIGDTRWVGNVEIHVRSSDWELHKHQHDNSYNNVILHVVYEHNREIEVAGKNVATLQLKDYLSEEFLSQFSNLSAGTFSSIPCERSLIDVAEIHKGSLMNRMLVERLIQKTEQLKFLYDANQQDLLGTFYQWLLIGFGQKVNKEAFHQLSQRLPLVLVKKYAAKPEQLEALVFGVSGLLPSHHNEEYVQTLIRNFHFLKEKHKLEPLPKETWKFLRMRPSNFPSLRLAQLSQLLIIKPLLVDFFSEPLTIEDLEVQFAINLDPFWSKHFSFEESSVEREKPMGQDFIRHLLLNVLIPFRFFRGQLIGENTVEELEELYMKLEPENNLITRKMVNAGFKNEHSAHSQALIQLHNLYCDPKKCLLCSIGYQILRT